MLSIKSSKRKRKTEKAEADKKENKPEKAKSNARRNDVKTEKKRKADDDDDDNDVDVDDNDVDVDDDDDDDDDVDVDVDVDDDDDDDDDGDNEDDNEINVDFEFFDPSREYIDSLSLFLKTYIQPVQIDETETHHHDNQTNSNERSTKQQEKSFDTWNYNELAEIICSQYWVGSIIKISDSDCDAEMSLVGFLTAINLHHYSHLVSVKQIKKYILSNVGSNQSGQLKQILDDKNSGLGLIINERLLNLPPQLSPRLHQTLFDEITEEIEEDQKEQDTSTSTRRNDGGGDFKFENYMIVTRVGIPTKKKEKKRKKQKKSKHQVEGNDLVYFYPEDEFYHKEATFSFLFPANKGDDANLLANWTLSGKMTQMRLVLIIHKSKIPNVLQALNANLQ